MAGELELREWIKRALLLISLGLLVQMFCLVHITPTTFLLYAAGGVGPVFVGLGLMGYGGFKWYRLRGLEGRPAPETETETEPEPEPEPESEPEPAPGEEEDE